MAAMLPIACAQAMPMLHAIVVARHGVAGYQRMIDRVAIVAVVGRARLAAMYRDGKAVDVNRDVPRGVVTASGPQMTLAAVRQAVA